MALARRMEVALLVAALVAMIWAEAAAQSSSCTNTIISMSPCLNYITGNSSTPSSSCCSQLASVVNSQPECLCQILNGGASSLGIQIDQARALALPKACNVQTPSVSLCNAISPAGTPPATKATPSVPSTPSGGGSKTTSTNSNTSDGSSNKMTFSLLFFLLTIASYASNFTGL
ncbi:PREDICTED: non-specific lipid-transfer protein-like protein At2g13820 [Nelumbo nucifera]|uniref:Bifunctional inhibitor/plant lipid transfer protein/seed storage helical domain-containing protein n=2 Tax=Nelumbo nucifera TaxID=4432 RepID=A0A822XKC8_NELNU|nr:PREDICTED: non-specific lipid-transfer protein-like protein At2g13820 [Nelumbo nucifera]DAD19591.1 TPA_asm: hypothetical protein HUJ06_021054 [Nelumbo nucifera]